MKFRSLVVTFLLGLWPFFTHAVTVNGLYQTAVPVSDETSQARAEALQQAMQQVLVKLSGNQAIAEQSGASEIIGNAQQYVQQFRYNQSQEPTSETPSLELVVKFDESALNNMMRSYGLTLWGKERPGILAWLAYDGPAGRNMMTFEEQPELLETIETAATARGIPLIFPLFDLEDAASLSVSDIWGGFRQPIMEASRRYQSDAIVTGRISQTAGGQWQTQWSLFMNQETETWSSEGDEAEQALKVGMNRLADALANSYANPGSSAAEIIQVTVSNISSNDDYARTLSYLDSLQFVTEVMVKTVEPGQVMFELVSHGGITALDQAIELGRVLQRVSGNAPNSYRFQAGY